MVSKKVLLSFLCLGLVGNQVQAGQPTRAELIAGANDLVSRYQDFQSGAGDASDEALNALIFGSNLNMETLKTLLASKDLDDLQDLHELISLYMNVLDLDNSHTANTILLQGIEPKSARKQQKILKDLPPRLLSLKRQIENAILAQNNPTPVNPTPVNPNNPTPTLEQMQKMLALTKELVKIRRTP